MMQNLTKNWPRGGLERTPPRVTPPPSTARPTGNLTLEGNVTIWPNPYRFPNPPKSCVLTSGCTSSCIAVGELKVSQNPCLSTTRITPTTQVEGTAKREKSCVSEKVNPLSGEEKKPYVYPIRRLVPKKFSALPRKNGKQAARGLRTALLLCGSDMAAQIPRMSDCGFVFQLFLCAPSLAIGNVAPRKEIPRNLKAHPETHFWKS